MKIFKFYIFKFWRSPVFQKNFFWGVVILLVSYVWNLCLNQGHKDFLLFSPRGSFVVSAFIFISLICSELRLLLCNVWINAYECLIFLTVFVEMTILQSFSTELLLLLCWTGVQLSRYLWVPIHFDSNTCRNLAV